jgi:DNA-binding transcriptional ArsR family regulator
VRRRILAEIAKPMSPSQLAVALGEPIGTVSYHVRELAEAGLLELVRTEPRRGALEHFYRVSRPAAKKIRKLADELGELADSLGR